MNGASGRASSRRRGTGEGTCPNRSSRAWLDDIGRDLRYGLRQIRRNPAFSSVAIATLALAIGAMTAIFSVWNGDQSAVRCSPHDLLTLLLGISVLLLVAFIASYLPAHRASRVDPVAALHQG